MNYYNLVSLYSPAVSRTSLWLDAERGGDEGEMKLLVRYAKTNNKVFFKKNAWTQIFKIYKPDQTSQPLPSLPHRPPKK